jgi:hypothetical protein
MNSWMKAFLIGFGGWIAFSAISQIPGWSGDLGQVIIAGLILGGIALLLSIFGKFH